MQLRLKEVTPNEVKQLRQEFGQIALASWRNAEGYKRQAILQVYEGSTDAFTPINFEFVL